MNWKSVINGDKPELSIMENSRYDLIIWDGEDYHRGFAKATPNYSRSGCFYKIDYFSHETHQYIKAVKFIEVAPAEKNLKMNIWRTLWENKKQNNNNKNNDMSSAKPLRELTEQQFDELKKSGLLKIIYPDAPKTFAEIKGTRPKPIDNPDLTKLIELCESCFDDLDKGEDEDSDNDHYIYEQTLKTIYGENVFDYVNSRLK